MKLEKKLSEQINEFADMINRCANVYKTNKNIESEMFKKQTDLLHDFEEPDLTYHEIARIGKAMRELRLHRRGYKNEYILYEPIVDFLKKYKTLVEDLRTLSENIVKVEKHLSNQYYNKRSKVDNIIGVAKDSSTLENKSIVELITLNNILDKVSTDHTSSVITQPNNKFIELEFSVTTNVESHIRPMRDKFLSIRHYLEKSFMPNVKDKCVQISTSDMVISANNDLKELDATYKIYDSSDLLCIIHGKLYTTNMSKLSSTKKKKRSKR